MLHSIVPGEASLSVNKHVVYLFGLCIFYEASGTVIHFARCDRLVVYNGLRVNTLNAIGIYLLVLKVPVEEVLVDDVEELVNDLCLFLRIL